MMLEACVTSTQAALAAQQHGVNRVELCAALELGGITPSIGLIEACCEQCHIPVHVLVRPRPGDFVYNQSELAVMASDIRAAAAQGAAGVVLGMLTPQQDVDSASLQSLVHVARAEHLQVTFHRAFDCCADPQTALHVLISHGVDHLLTSGQAPTAWEGRAMLRQWAEQVGNKIRIIAAGGIRPANAPDVAATGVDALHFSVHVQSQTLDPRFGATSDIDVQRIQTMAQWIAKFNGGHAHDR